MNLSETQIREMIERIEMLIAQKRMKKKDFYAASGISSSLYSQWNTGAVKPSLRFITQAADVLEVSANYLMYGKEKAPSASDDAELNEYLEELRTRPEMKMLFHTFKGATKEEIAAIVAAWEAMNRRGE